MNLTLPYPGPWFCGAMPRTRRWTLRALLAATGLAVSVAALVVSTSDVMADRAEAAPANVVGMAPTPSGAGFWLVSSDGSVVPAGDAAALGSMAGQALNYPVVAMAATPTGRGYWLVASDGGIFSFGDAKFLGSTGGMRLNQPIVGIAATPTGRGYWLVASDGGIFSYGDAKFYGSTGNLKLVQPITAMTSTATGKGYWLTADDGGIFTFGDAKFLGSGGGQARRDAVVGMASSASGGGYWLVSQGGTVLAYGDAPNLGSVTPSAPVVGIMRQPGSNGYIVAVADGTAKAFGGSAPIAPAPVPVPNAAPASIESQIAADIVVRINEERAARGLAALTYDPNLASLAGDWSRTMATTGQFVHRDLGAAMGIAGISGRFQGLGENIAWAGGGALSSGRIHSMLMNSASHRANILQSGFDTVGVAVTCVNGTIYATENFGRLASSTAAGYTTSTPALAPIVRNDTTGPAC
jgi:uncharacterized protein YkwD